MKEPGVSLLSESVLLILLSLAEQPRHGYAILKDVEEMSRKCVVLSTGALYGALHRLLEDHWIEGFQENLRAAGQRTASLVKVEGDCAWRSHA